MLTRSTYLCVGCLVLFGVAVAFSGCSKEKEEEKGVTAVAPPKVKVDISGKSHAEIQRDMDAKLKAADALDGKVDRVVKKCAGCNFKMDGSEDYQLGVLNYTMCFCSEKCMQDFALDETQSVLAMEVPKK